MKWFLLLSVGLCLGATLPRQSQLDAAVSQFAQAWRAGNADAISGALAPEGIRLQLLSEDHPMLAGRQARAALAEFLATRTEGRMEEQRAGELGGSPARGSAEFRWQTVVRGTTEAMVHTIFVGFTRSGNDWRITDIRVR